MLADSFIVARDSSGAVRVMFNMCLHRGMQVCRAERGNASTPPYTHAGVVDIGLFREPKASTSTAGWA